MPFRQHPTPHTGFHTTIESWTDFISHSECTHELVVGMIFDDQRQGASSRRSTIEKPGTPSCNQRGIFRSNNSYIIIREGEGWVGCRGLKNVHSVMIFSNTAWGLKNAHSMGMLSTTKVKLWGNVRSWSNKRDICNLSICRVVALSGSLSKYTQRVAPGRLIPVVKS